MSLFGDFYEGIPGDDKIRKVKGEIEPQTSSDENNLDSLEESPLEKITKPSLFWFYLAILLLFGGLLIKVWSLQISQGGYFRFLAEGNRIRTKTISAIRGVIYDNQGQLLAKNSPSFNLEIQPVDLPRNSEERIKVLDQLAQLTGLAREEIDKKIEENEHTGPFILLENLEREKALMLKEKLANTAGIVVEERATRGYQPGVAFSHILGYVGKITKEELATYKDKGYQMTDLIGKTGLELSYEETLKGKNGRQQVEVDATGKIVRILATAEAQSGANLVLTLDSRLQEKMSQVLTASLAETKSKGGAAIAVDPSTGGILGLVSLPNYDNNIFTTKSGGELVREYQKLLTNPTKPLFNRAISGVYPPGSTIKPLMAVAGLAEKIISISTKIFDPGEILVPNKYNPAIVYRFPDWKPDGHGTLGVVDAIAQSCDVFFYSVGGGYEKISGLGPQKIEEYFRRFSLGSQTGVDLPGEHEGLVPNEEWKQRVKKEGWYQGDTYHISIGQGDLLVTPLQLVNYIAAIANGGTLMQPHLVSKIVDAEGNVIKEFGKEVKAENLAEGNLIEIVRQGMRKAVTSGTAKQLSGLPFSVAGKTGTAQFDNNTKTHSWFVSFAPYENPKIALVVLVEGGGEGHQVAVPATQEILNYYFTR